MEIGHAQMGTADRARRATDPTAGEPMSRWDATAVRRIIRAHGVEVAEHGGEWELAELVAVRDELEAAIGTAIKGVRDRGLSWANVGDALGVTKSAAYQRYGSKS